MISYKKRLRDRNTDSHAEASLGLIARENQRGG